MPFRDLAEPFAILLSDDLTHEAEDAFTEEAKTGRPNRTGGFQQHLRPHTQDDKGLNKAPLVEGRGLEPCADP